MPNKNYIKGVRKERKIVNEARQEGLISFRSAGSHSPIDVVIIDPKDRIIRLIQCKPASLSHNKRQAIRASFGNLNGIFVTRFQVI